MSVEKIECLIIIALLAAVVYLIAKKKGVKADNIKEKCGRWLSLLLAEGERTKSPFFYAAIVANVLILYYTGFIFVISLTNMLWLLLSIVCGVWADYKGYFGIKYFGVSWLVTPFVALFMVKHLDDRRAQERKENAERKERQKQEWEERYEKQKQEWAAEKTEAKQNQKSGGYLGCFGFLFVLAIVALLGAGLYLKKGCIDYNGEYAQNRLVYAGEEYGFCVLTMFYPNNRIDGAKGFAITNMTLTEAVDFALSHKKGEYYSSLTPFADSKYIFNNYKLVGTGNKLLEMGNLGSLGMKSFEIGKYGSYFVIDKGDVSSMLEEARQQR